MKITKTIGIAVVALMFGMVSLEGATSKQKLVGTLQREQKSAEMRIVKLWERNKRGAELEKILADYSVREMRLQTLSGSSRTRSIMSTLIRKGKVAFKTPRDLAAAIVREFYLRKGIDLDKKSFIAGRYLIRKKCMAKADYSHYKWQGALSGAPGSA
ncbi:MAG: hypothetical protein GXP32_10105 [Kiritimatiellaeota bacterium]|nr:hypothetical protein [Kiritimatiellota bacterium]